MSRTVPAEDDVFTYERTFTCEWTVESTEERSDRYLLENSVVCVK